MVTVATTIESALATVAAPTLDVRVLTSAPQAALMIQSLSILAACTIDASLENNRTAGMIKLLKTPRSFRGSLYQTSASMSDAFRTADQAMLRIKINLNDIPSVVTSLINAYAKPVDVGSRFIMDLRMKNFEEIAKICTTEAERARQKFDDTLDLIQELVQVTTATQGDNEEKMRETKKAMEAYDKMRKNLHEQKERLQQEIFDQRRKLKEAKEQYMEATNKMTSVGHQFLSTILNVVGSFSRLAGLIISFFNPNNNDILKANASSFGPISYSRRLQIATEMAKELYLREQSIHRVSLKEEETNRKELAEIAGKLANSSLEILNVEETIYYLGRGIMILGRIQEQWTTLQVFFSSMESEVIGPMRRHLSDFDAILKQKEDIENSELLRLELAKSGIRGALVCLSISRSAHIYNQVSRTYVLPIVDKSVTKMTLTIEDAKTELSLMEQRMQNVTEESHTFIDEQLEKEQNITVGQILHIYQAFESAFGVTTPASLP